MTKQTSAIEWTDVTWNPLTGCDTVSPGCENCYARTLSKRLKAMGAKRYQNDGDPVTSGPGFALTMHPELIRQPLTWRKPRMVFVNSMSDLFHKDVTDDFIASVFATMALTPRHTYQVLTKRHGRLRSLLSAPRFAVLVNSAITDIIFGGVNSAIPAADIDAARARVTDTDLASDPMPPLANVWIGVSAEDQHWADIRIPSLLATPAAIRFVSAEPLLGPIDLHANDDGVHNWLPDYGPSYGMDYGDDPICQAHGMAHCWQGCAFLNWVIVGGESGPGHRPIEADWVRLIRDQCAEAGTAFFFKQWGGARPKAGGKDIDGRTHEGWPR